MIFRGKRRLPASLLSTALLAAGLAILPSCAADSSKDMSGNTRTHHAPGVYNNAGDDSHFSGDLSHTVSGHSTARAAKPAPKAAAPTKTTTQPKPKRAAPVSTTSSRSGMNRSSLSFPTGDPNTSALTLEKVMPHQVMVGEPFDYIMNVTNVSDVSLDNVVVTDTLPSGFNVTNSQPNFASRTGDGARWNLGSLAPGETKTIRLKASASGTGSLFSCASVAYDSSLCSTINVVQPALQLVKRAPSEVLICEEIPVSFRVTNSGTGSAQNVVITDPLPQGWTSNAGQREIKINVGTLAAGESKDYTVKVKSSRAGEFKNTATANASNNLRAESGTTTTAVRQPVLQIAKRAPERRYAGTDITYQIAVRNTGDTPARNLVVRDTLSESVRFKSASDNGRNSGRNVVWNVNELAPGATKTFTLTVNATAIGNIRNTVVAEADCAPEVSANTQTVVEGIPGLLLECIDLADPIEVGQNITYVITATNQGSAPGTDIKITCELPDSMTHVSSDGTTRSTVRGNTITFATLPSLAVGQKATWRIVTTAKTAEVARISVVMEANELRGKTMSETEATILYE